MPNKGRFDVTLVVQDGQVTEVLGCPEDVAEPVDLWLPASEKRRLEKRIEELQERLRVRQNEESEGVNWRIEYLILRHRCENPHLYDSKGCPTPEALEKEQPKGGPIYSAPMGDAIPEHCEDRRVVTMHERLLELASAFRNRADDDSLTVPEQQAWMRAFVDLITLRHHGMDRPDLALCLKCGGTHRAFPEETEWVDAPDYVKPGSKDAERAQAKEVDGKLMVPQLKRCSCQEGFDPDADITQIIDD